MKPSEDDLLRLGIEWIPVDEAPGELKTCYSPFALSHSIKGFWSVLNSSQRYWNTDLGLGIEALESDVQRHKNEMERNRLSVLNYVEPIAIDRRDSVYPKEFD